MFVVTDMIVGEKLSFKNRYDAEVEVERRLSIHRNGYSVRRTYVPPIKCHVSVEGDNYIICLD